MGKLGWTSVVIQIREAWWTLSVSRTVSRSSSMKSSPRWQFCRSTQVPCAVHRTCDGEQKREWFNSHLSYSAAVVAEHALPALGP